MRKLRMKRYGAVYHVVARANRGEFILNSRQIKEMLIKILKRAKQKYDFHLKHFCIMSNHIHLIIEPIKQTDLSRLMQWILSVFALKYNRYFGYKGHVWYDRYKSKIIESLVQFIKTFQYISDNPVNAGICRNIKDYDFSGINYIMKGNQQLLEQPDKVISIFFPEFSLPLLNLK